MTVRLDPSGGLVLALALVLSAGPLAHAQGVAGAPLWTAAIANSGVPAAPATDIDYNPTTPSVYVAQNTTLYAFNAKGTGAGATRWTRNLAPTVLSNYPSPVPLQGGQNVIFFGGSDGRLYAVNAANGTNFWAPIDFRRASCPAEDQIVATPAVQLRTFSNAAFKAASTDDLVFVATRYGCTTTTENRVYAVRASTGAIAWTFNLTGGSSLDYASEGCSVDYDLNRLYCAFNQPASAPTQNSLYALDTATSNAAGSKVWAVNAGSIRTRPTPRGTKIYVATYDGWLRARSLTNGVELWSTRVTSTKNLAKNPWPEARATAGYDSYITIIDSGGSVYCYSDSTGSGVLKWILPGYGANSMVASAPFMSRLYIGKTDGTIHELDYSTGAERSSYRVGSSTGAIYDPALANESRTNGQEADRVFVASASQLGLFSIPWSPCTWDATNSVWACTATGGANGTCSGPPPACSDACGAGYRRCNTTYCSISTNTCTSPNTCCNSTWGVQCLNTQSGNDANNCGGCGLACPSGQTCSGGACVACGVSCGGTTPLCNSSNQCICSASPDSCGALGPNMQCNTITGACQCQPVCNQNYTHDCGPDGCGGFCGVISTGLCQTATKPTCSAGGTCQCTTSPNSCAATVTTPVCSTTTGECACTTSPNSCYSASTPLSTCNAITGKCDCVPNCSGKICGNDGCGGTCAAQIPAECADGFGSTPGCNASGTKCMCQNPGIDPYYYGADTCSAHLGAQFHCNTSTGDCYCTPSCAGKNCGPDVCGGSCGTCTNPAYACDYTGVCGCSSPPDTCTAAYGAQFTCGYSGGWVCQCTPSCAGKACGAADGCGGLCSAGSCTAPQTCGGGGTPNVCGCTPFCPSCRSVNVSNGCGGTCLRNCRGTVGFPLTCCDDGMGAGIVCTDFASCI